MNETEQLVGTVDRIIYVNQESGFTVFTLHLQHKKIITAKGLCAAINPGQQIVATGMWSTHTQFGRQFDIQEYTLSMPTSLQGIKKYLGSGLIKGIGPTYAEKLVHYFGADVLTVIDQHADRLNEVPGIGPKRAHNIALAWQEQKDIAHVMVFLQEKNVSPTYATKIYKHYGKESIALIMQNPYRLAYDIWGIGFKTADQIASSMGIASNSIKRLCAGIVFVIQEHISTGNLYIELEELRKKTMHLLTLDESLPENHLNIKKSLHTVHEEKKIILITKENTHYITLSQYYFAEKGVAKKIKELLAQPIRTVMDFNATYNSLRTSTSSATIYLSDEQQHAIMTCLQNKVTVITGGPGTGKTTIIKTLLTILDKNKYPYVLAAPTGRAAKRITQSTGQTAKTIHRLLEFDVSTFTFTRNEQNAINTDFIIIDEASMIDIFLAHAILKAASLNAHIIFIGDIHQLPSVGAGNFLNDLIASALVPCIRLKTIFRQAQDSMIIVNAHRINQGEFPLTATQNNRSDYFFIKEPDPQNIIYHLKTIFNYYLSQKNISPADTVVLTPMNRGIAGTHTLNHHLQELLNHAHTEKKFLHAGTLFKIGDRVMQIRNNYDKNIFNGDMGYVEDVSTEEYGLIVRFDHQLVEYKKNELDELTLAYAISIHKSQGSEFPAVIIPLFMQHFTLLQRNLLYTAVTRAKKLCILIGQTKAIAIAIKNNKGIERITFLNDFLTTDLSCYSN